jgi:hypothetical protein
MQNRKCWIHGLLLVVALLSCTAYAQQFSGWNAPVNLGAPVNTPYTETDPAISKDGLSLYFFCADCKDAQGTVKAGMYVSQRLTVEQPWEQPQYLEAINQYAPVSGPTFSPDGHRMYFTGVGLSGASGDTDLYVARRHNKRDDFGWRTPESLTALNTPFEEGWAVPFEDEATGVTYLYFVSNRPGGLGDSDIYVSTLQPDETWDDPLLVEELSSPARDRHPTLRRDGLEIFFMSNRSGSLPNALGQPSFDIWTSTRASTSHAWSEPVNVDSDAFGQVVPNINTGRHDGRPSLSFDGTTLYFMSAQRPGNQGAACLLVPPSAACKFDIWMATRSKVTGAEENSQ